MQTVVVDDETSDATGGGGNVASRAGEGRCKQLKAVALSAEGAERADSTTDPDKKEDVMILHSLPLLAGAHRSLIGAAVGMRVMGFDGGRDMCRDWAGCWA